MDDPDGLRAAGVVWAAQFQRELPRRTRRPAQYGPGAALDEFRQDISTEDTKLKSDAIYNMGNTMYNQGKYQESLNFYKQDYDIKRKDFVQPSFDRVLIQIPYLLLDLFYSENRFKFF